jgi:hypothetical protein
MSVAEALGLLARGQPHPALLNTCRLEAFGTSFHGEEEVLHALRRHPVDCSSAQVLVGARQAALLTPHVALIADLYVGRIGRLWRVTAGRAEPRDAAVSVAFDPDLAQARGALFMRAADHELPPAAVPQVQVAAETILKRETKALRTRLFLVRSFVTEEGGVALFARYQLEAGVALGFSYVAASLETGADPENVRFYGGETGAPPSWRTSFL